MGSSGRVFKLLDDEFANVEQGLSIWAFGCQSVQCAVRTP